MQRLSFTFAACLCTLLLLASGAVAAPVEGPRAFTNVEEQIPDLVGDPAGARALARKAAADTVWIADWSFDSEAGCTSVGWTQYDYRILNGNDHQSGLEVDGHPVWTIVGNYSGQGLISGNAAKLGIHNLCWPGDGYGNNWDYGIRLSYKGNTTLNFDLIINSEACCDFLTVEGDSACSSFARLDYTLFPNKQSVDFRVVAGFHASGVTPIGTSQHVTAYLPDFGAPGTSHCAYIRFASDGGGSAEDGDITLLGYGLVVDNIALTSGALNYTEDFSGALGPNVAFVNMSPTLGFGTWARLYQHVTDNDKCTENTSCAWLWSDPSVIATDASVAYGPGSAVVRNWLDDVIVSPWVSLSTTPVVNGTVLTFRRFFGNYFAWGKIAQSWAMRSHTKVSNTDTTDPADSVDCITPWLHGGSWSVGGATATWSTSAASVSQYIATGAHEIQLRWRVSDWQYLTGDLPPNPFRTGPGPYLDRIRIGRLILTGPVIDEGIDNRSQAQDCFATVPFATGVNTGQHFAPGTDRFGTCAFSRGGDLAIGKSGPNLVTGDSISVQVTDSRAAGGITSVQWYGQIYTGPHAGKAPAPYAVGGNGFFAVPGDSCRGGTGIVIAGKYFVDLDDTYFRGGDGLVYFWAATDAGGGFRSDPIGMTSLPANRTAAEAATGGLLEVNFLPTINWSPAYLARIAADAHGDLDPIPAELVDSHQARCILYDEQVNFRRLSGDVNRTSMMYTLDRLGYRGFYDVYDMAGLGNTNNQLGGRATVAQATGYALVVQDNGRGTLLTLPDGVNIDSEKVNQAQWYRNYLASGSLSEIGTATLWIESENTVAEKKSNPLIAVDMGVTFVANDQGLGSTPNVEGQTSFTWANGSVASFVGDSFVLSGGCPAVRNYDALGASGAAVVTHKYKAGSTLGPGAIVMNRNASLRWNTVMASFGWFDVRDLSGSASGPDPTNPSPEAVLMAKILGGALPNACVQAPNPVPVPEPPMWVTALYQNVPNPFNPTTVIRFDLAQQGQVEIRIFAVSGRAVRTLVSGKAPVGPHVVIWNGLDDAGHSVASGVYFYELVTADYRATRKLVVLR